MGGKKRLTGSDRAEQTDPSCVDSVDQPPVAYFHSKCCSVERRPRTWPFPWSLRRCITRCTGACAHSLLNPHWRAGEARPPVQQQDAVGRQTLGLQPVADAEAGGKVTKCICLGSVQKLEHSKLLTVFRKSPICLIIARLAKLPWSLPITINHSFPVIS